MKYPIALLMLTLCGAAVAAPYSAPIRQEYVKSCTQAFQAAVPGVDGTPYCSCTLTQIEQKISEAEFIEAGMNVESRPDHAAVKKVNQASDAAVKFCVDQAKKQ